jgi:pimeloyl-ACP methyl ester carboxylesterase
MRWFILLLFAGLAGQPVAQKVLYCIPGQGADARAFWKMDIEGYTIVPLQYLTPLASESLPQYARRMAVQIDTTRQFSILGVSLGGMIAVEMTDFLRPERTIIISSASNSGQLAGKYKLVRALKPYNYLSGKWVIAGAMIAQPVLEPVDAACRNFFRSMLLEKDPWFMEQASRMIAEWNRTETPPGIVHIHGRYDHTLPLKHINAHIVVNAGHMMVLQYPELVNGLVRWVLEEFGA